jgi:short-subunit dehydrogenase
MSTVHLAKLVVQEMVDRREGGKIMFTSSIAATMPGPYEAVYAASKAFIQSFSLGLRYEMEEYGIVVTALQPGATETNFFHRAHMDDTKVGAQKKDSAADVAQQGFDALMAGKDAVIAGSFKTRWGNAANDLIPEGTKAKMHASAAKPGSAAGESAKKKKKS